MLKKYLPLLSIVAILYIALGDKVLPGALGQASAKTRGAVNGFVIGLFPDWSPKTNPYERTEKAIEREEAGGQAP
jgi:hypothetical protein